MDKERYINLSDRQVKDTQNQSQAFLSVKDVCRLLNNQDSKIADLEAKLAEREKTEDGAFWFEKWQHKKRDYDSVYKAYIENCAEVDQLKQQLKEKEKELQEVMGNVVGLAKSREIIALEKVQRFIDDEIEIPNDIGALMLADFFNKEIEKIKTSETYVSYEQSQNQTAIEELKKVKILVQNAVNSENSNLVGVYDAVDQQINKLKGEK